jgi:hypothetical protein
MMEIAFDENQPTERRDTMLLAAASYACPKAGTIQHQFVCEAPHITTIDQAENFLASLAIEFAPELNPVELSSLIRAWIASKREGAELDHKLHPPETRPQLIQIVGGLGALPGTNVMMPENKNGEIVQPQSNGHPSAPMIEATAKEFSPGTNQAQTEAAKEFSPGDLKASGPHPLQERHFKSEEPRKNSGNGGQEPCT